MVKVINDQALKAYKEAITPAWKAHQKAITRAEEDYREVETPAWKAYNEARALATLPSKRKGALC